MRTYVTSDQPQARLFHLGTSYWTACGFVPSVRYTVSKVPPANRVMCARCVKRYEPHPTRDMAAARELRRAVADARRAELDATLLEQLRQGRTKTQIARSLRMGLRTVERHTSRMRRATRSRTMFQWGYRVGLSEARES